MELLFRLYGVLQIILCTVLEPIYWIIAKLDNTVPLQPITKPVLCMSATQMAAKIRSGEVCIQRVIYCYVLILLFLNVKYFQK